MRGANVGGTHARVCSVVLAHVDYLRGFFNSPESGFDHGFRFAHKGHYGAVGGLARVYIKQTNAGNGLDDVGYFFDYVHVAAFAEIGHALRLYAGS